MLLNQRVGLMEEWLAYYKTLTYTREQYVLLNAWGSTIQRELVAETLRKEEERFATCAPKIPEDLSDALKAFLG
jgi:hypothetical protein